MKIPKIIKLTLIIILGSLVVTSGSYSIYKYIKTKNRPNVILITIDALRPDHMSCYGYKRNTTPNIDKFAKEGVVFTQAISQSSYTASSLPSILTSTYPHTHEILEWGDKLNPSVFTLAQILKKKDYYCVAISAHDFFVSLLGLDKGFDEIVKGDELKANEITKRAINWINKNQKEKFFLWLHYFDPHEPYTPPAPYNKMFINPKEEDSELVPILKYTPVDPDIYGGFGGVPERTIVDGIREIGYYISLYDGEIRFTDEQIGILLNEIDKLKLIENSLIVITADHGESLGEHNLYFTHGDFLYDELIKVPLIFKYNNLLPKGKKIKSPVQLIDIIPTILDILGIKYNRKIEGVSLLSLIQGRRKKTLTPYAFSYVTGTELYSIRSEKYKLIYSKNKEEYELYNLENDPDELNNLVDIEKGKFKFLKAKLDEWIKQLPPRQEREGRVLVEETKEKLKSLGYMQ